MIATVTANPCLDYNLQVDELVRNETARAKGALLFPGGGGVNVARAVKQLGGVPVKAYGFAGGRTGETLRSLLDAEEVEHDFIDTGLDTRINVLLTLTPDRSLVRVHAAGPEVDEAAGTKLMKQLAGLDPKPKVVVLGGSLPGRKIPPPLPRDFYSRVTDDIKAKHPAAKVILACREPVALGHGVDKGPFAVVLSAAELGHLDGRRALETVKDVVAAAERFIKEKGVVNFLVLRGEHGAVLVNATDRFQISNTEAVGFTRVAAADAFVGGLAWALAQDEPIDVAAQHAMTVGTATVLSPAAALFRKEEVDKLHSKTQIERV